ncbi:MAG: Gfo/Idh/MocA family oxidoreductase [Candidatus Methanoperedens sp.]|nr:Gfo/Idh/MocA family oxidoreductase [Candidatus Methanoperedens sp.]
MKLNIGIIGCGNIAKSVHLPILVKNPDIKAVFISDTDAKALENIGERFGIEGNRRFPDYSEFLGFVDAVFILTPPHTHYALVMDCLNHKKHIFVEKPLCMTADEALSIEKTAGNAGLIVETGYNLRYMPQMKLAKKLLKKGHIGRIITINGYYLAELAYLRENKSFYLDPKKGGGVLMDGLCHLIDISSWLADSSIEEAYGFSGTYDDLPVENIADISVRFENGVIGHLQALWAPLSEYLHTEMLKTLRVVGDRGVLTPAIYSGKINEYRAGKGTHTIYPENTDLRNPMWALNRSYLEQDTTFINHIKEGLNNFNKLKESVRIIEILDAIKKNKAYKR